MDNAGRLLFGNLPSFPTAWMLALLGFVAFWWYVWRSVSAIRRLFLALWGPAAIVAGAIHSLDGRGYAVTESLRRLVHRDPSILRIVHWVPTSGISAAYAAVTGGAIAVLATTALQILGVLFGAVLALVPATRLNPLRLPLPRRRPS